MLDAIKPLLDSQLINESTGEAITEAFEAKLNEAREQVRAELRELHAKAFKFWWTTLGIQTQPE